MSQRPLLSRALVETPVRTGRTEVEMPPLPLLSAPEKIVQFGTGAFLRGFFADIIDDANRRGTFNGSIVAVGSTGSGRDAVLNDQDGLFTLVTEGIEDGLACQRFRVVASVNRALSAQQQWADVIALARSPAIELIVSNTTEVGIAFDPNDAPSLEVPRSFPGKLTRFLHERAKHFAYAEERGVVVLPCELIERNGDELRRIVLELAERWQLEARFTQWITKSCVFCNTLVDRIVTGSPAAEEAEVLAEILGFDDGMVTVCEPFRLFAIEGNDALRARLGFTNGDETIVIADDIAPFRTRKVRILNGAHTIMAAPALLCGLETVYQAMADDQLGRFVRHAVFEEIAPTLDVPNADDFAAQVFERFANPYLRHALVDIMLQSTAKMRVRIVPSVRAHIARSWHVPPSLAFGFAAWLLYMRGDIQANRRSAGLCVPADAHADRLRDAWRTIDRTSDEGISALVRAVCDDAVLWGKDLSQCDGFAEAVTSYLARMCRFGVDHALAVHLAADTAGAP
jgi:tagaturonate reductase